MNRNIELFRDYAAVLSDIKSHIRNAQTKAGLAVNRELLMLYWQIGKTILEKQAKLDWGAKVVDRLAGDLRSEFPNRRGFSARNLKYMRSFAEAWPRESIVQEVLAQITWYHNIAILEKVKDRSERLWYAEHASQQGWSRNVLVHQIESNLYKRQGRAQTNFAKTLPAPDSELALELLKDPYHFDFLTLSDRAKERELHQGLLSHMRSFLLELGVGFSFVGSEYHLQVGQSDFYIDLLFYHLKLRSFVVLELKTGAFKPEYTGKMNFYLSAVDELLRHPDDKASIGIILCKSRDDIVAEYALRDISKPIGVTGYRHTRALPSPLLNNLPSIEQLKNEF